MLLDEKDQPAVTTKITRDAAGRPVAIDDGRGKREVSYNRAGYPTEVKDVFGNVTKVCYNTFNVPVKVIDANGIVTEYEYNADGLVTAVTRKDGVETLASVSVAYDRSGLPVSYVGQDGLVTSFDRDAFGRVLKETFADGSEVGYTYDEFGRLVYVDYGNGESEKFVYDHFGRIARQTVDGSLIDYEYTRRGQLAYCNNGVTRAVDYLGCGIVESTIQSAVQEQLNKYTDSNLIQEALNKVSLPSFSPSDDLKVAMSIKVEISDIQVKYRHGIIWETEATMKLDDRDISTDYINTFSRTEPEKYCKRDKKGDRLGPSGVVNNTTNVVLDNIEYSQSKWGHTVTVEEISFCVNITVDFTTVWKHYKPE